MAASGKIGSGPKSSQTLSSAWKMKWKLEYITQISTQHSHLPWIKLHQKLFKIRAQNT